MNCLYCGTEIGGRSRKYCDEHCRNEKNKESLRVKYNENLVEIEVVCIYCGKVFKTTKINIIKYCSKHCSIEFHKENGRIHDKVFKCKICGKMFERSKAEKTCSEECREINFRNNIAKARKKGRELNGRTDKHSKRFKGSLIDKDISLKKLVIKDNNICHICGQECDSNDFIECNNTIICGDNYPSIDHVIPASKGGTHTWDNVRLAHRKCNYIKSDKLVEYEENGQTRLYI